MQCAKTGAGSGGQATLGELAMHAADAGCAHPRDGLVRRVALIRNEMVRMPMGRSRLDARGHLEPRWLPRQLDADDLTGVLQPLDLAVDGRQVQAGHGRFRLPQQLLRAQGLPAAHQRIEHGLTLPGVTFHPAMLMQLHWH